MGTPRSGKKNALLVGRALFAFDLLSGWSPLQHAAYLVLMCVEQHWLCPARPLEDLLGRCTGLRKHGLCVGATGFSAGGAALLALRERAALIAFVFSSSLSAGSHESPGLKPILILTLSPD
jgi:hypothetical protein